MMKNDNHRSTRPLRGGRSVAIALAAIISLTLAGCSSGSAGAGGSSSPPSRVGGDPRRHLLVGGSGGRLHGCPLHGCDGSVGLVVGIHGVGQPRNRREFGTAIVRIGCRHPGHPRLVRRGQEDACRTSRTRQGSP